MREYERMHALENHYWWFVGRRAIVRRLLREALPPGSAPPEALPPGSALLGSGLASGAAASTCGSGAGVSLLDIGCGTGANLSMLRQAVGRGARVTAVDFSDLALKFAAQANQAQGIAVARCDALRLPFGGAAFSTVTMLDVLEHLSDDRAALAEVSRVLRPGGRYVFSVPAYQHLWSAHDEALHHFRRYELRELGALLRQSGFVVEKLSFAMSAMPPAAWLWRKLILPFAPRRPRHAARHSQGAVLPTVPPIINRALIKYLEAEGKLIARRPLQFGTSLVGIARKRGG